VLEVSQPNLVLYSAENKRDKSTSKWTRMAVQMLYLIQSGHSLRRSHFTLTETERKEND